LSINVGRLKKGLLGRGQGTTESRMTREGERNKKIMGLLNENHKAGEKKAKPRNDYQEGGIKG